MPEYHGRYTCSGDLQLQIVDYISRNAQNYILAREYATREHLQCYIEYENTKKTWDNNFRKKFMTLDRRDKYFKLDRGSTIYYVCKFDAKLPPVDYEEIIKKHVVSSRGFTNEQIWKFNQYYWDHMLPEKDKQNISLQLSELPISLPEESCKKVKKPKTPTFMTQCRNELEEEFPNLIWEKKHKTIVFMKVMRKLSHGCKNLDHIIISRMTYGVLNSLIKDNKEWDQYWFKKSFGEDLNYDDIFEFV